MSAAQVAAAAHNPAPMLVVHALTGGSLEPLLERLALLAATEDGARTEVLAGHSECCTDIGHAKQCEVPAPSALLVFLVGLLGLGARRRA